MRLMSRWLRMWRVIAGAVLVGMLSVGAYPLVVSRTRAAPLPSMSFNHEIMVQAGITCLYCHADAAKSPAAGMPSMEKCMGCHRVIGTDSPQIKLLTNYWTQQQPVLWPRLEQMPRFVYFSHRVHIGPAGLNCERCHGDVGHMAMAKPVVKMNMGWCLSCHERQPNVRQLQDCIVCHQ